MSGIANQISELHRLRRVYTDRLLTLLTVVLMLAMFVFAPLQAVGIFVFQGFAIAALLAIIGSMFVISDHPAALAVMFVCLTANIVVFVLRLYYPPWPYNLYRLGFCLACHRSHSRSGRRPGGLQAWPRHLSPHRRRHPAVLAHRRPVWDAVHLRRAVDPRCNQGNNIRRQRGPCQFGLLSEFRNSDVDRIRGHRSGASDRTQLCILETVIGQLYPATLAGEDRDPRNASRRAVRVDETRHA